MYDRIRVTGEVEEVEMCQLWYFDRKIGELSTRKDCIEAKQRLYKDTSPAMDLLGFSILGAGEKPRIKGR